MIFLQSSVKALALLSCTLEKITSRWFTYVEEICQLSKISIQDILECRDVIKSVLFGQQKKVRPPRSKKFMKRQMVLIPRKQILSPIDEIPHHDAGKLHSETMEMESSKYYLFNEEMARLRNISLDDIPIPSPSKRRKLNSCSIESKISHGFNGLLTSPVKTLSVWKILILIYSFALFWL